MHPLTLLLAGSIITGDVSSSEWENDQTVENIEERAKSEQSSDSPSAINNFNYYFIGDDIQVILPGTIRNYSYVDRDKSNPIVVSTNNNGIYVLFGTKGDELFKIARNIVFLAEAMPEHIEGLIPELLNLLFPENTLFETNNPLLNENEQLIKTLKASSDQLQLHPFCKLAIALNNKISIQDKNMNIEFDHIYLKVIRVKENTYFLLSITDGVDGEEFFDSFTVVE